MPYKNKTGDGKQYSHWSSERKARHRAVVAAKGLNRKKTLVELFGGSCILCGYSKCLRALTFHHRDPSQKMFELNVNQIKGKPWEVVIAEAQKCDLLCTNCHIEIHAVDYEGYIDIEVIQINKKEPNVKNTKVKQTYPCPQCHLPRNYHPYPEDSLCATCYKESTRKVIRPPLDILEAQIAELGYSAVGRLYGVSDNSIRKWIKAYHRSPPIVL